MDAIEITHRIKEIVRKLQQDEPLSPNDKQIIIVLLGREIEKSGG